MMLRFYARGTACVPDPHGADSVPMRRRIVGRKHEQVSPGAWAWVPMPFGKPEEIAYHHDLKKAAGDGELWPADEETAKACGVPFDPTFGGEVAAQKSPPKKAAADAASKESV